MDANAVLRPAGFWDALSSVPLVRAALQELDQRTKDSGTHISPALDNVVTTPSSIQKFARHGGPDLVDLRGFPSMPSSQRAHARRGDRRGSGRVRKPRATRACTTSSRSRISDTPLSHRRSSIHTKSSSPYDAAFKQHLIDWKVWPIDHFLATGQRPPPPLNIDEIKTELLSSSPSRASLDRELFTGQEFDRYCKAYLLAREEEAQGRTLDVIEGPALSTSSSQVKRGPFMMGNLFPLLPANLVPGNPDRAYGARPESLNLSIRRELEHLILPTTALDILCPNFIVHIKGPSGNADRAKLQAVYDGALAARGIHALSHFGCSAAGEAYEYSENTRDAQNDGFGQDSDAIFVDSPARTITCTYVDGILRMYTVHIRRRTQNQKAHEIGGIEYITTRIGSWFMQDSIEDFRNGAAAFRYGLEWAQRQRNQAIAMANATMENGRVATDPGRQSTHQDRPGSAGSDCPSSIDPLGNL